MVAGRKPVRGGIDLKFNQAAVVVRLARIYRRADRAIRRSYIENGALGYRSRGLK